MPAERAVFHETLTGKVAVITGSTAGIGVEIARQLLEQGACVVINGRDTDKGAAVEARLVAEFEAERVAFFAADARSPAECEALFSCAAERFGGIDSFVHCSGIGISPKPFQKAEISSFQPLIDGHLLSLLHACHFAVPHLVARGGGSIVTVASDAGKVATPGEAIIGAMKAAVIMFTRGLALELSRHSIRANCITPSFVINTPANDRMRAGEFTRKLVEKADAKARLGLTRPTDIADLALFLIGPGSQRLTGQAISVNGGISAA